MGQKRCLYAAEQGEDVGMRKRGHFYATILLIFRSSDCCNGRESGESEEWPLTKYG